MSGSRRLVVIMFTDLAGFTAAAQSDEAATLRRLEEQEGLVRAALVPFGGREIKSTGDGLLVEFDSALKAIECAVEIQRRLFDRNARSPDPPIELRIGLHAGDVEERDGDVFGDAVNVAARVLTASTPGGVCISQQVYDHVWNKTSSQFEKLPARALKGVAGTFPLYRVVLPWTSSVPERGPSEGERIAVLPFRSMSPDPDNAYFAEGIAEELITALSKIRGLTVIARTSVMGYRDSAKRVAEISRELGVDRVIEGSVRKAGSRVRITVQLLDATTEGHLWAQNYDRDLRDVFDVQSDVATRVAEALRVRVKPAEVARLKKPSTANDEAHLWYLKGRYHWGRRTTVGVHQAIRDFEQAISLDPGYVSAMAGLADSYLTLTDAGAMEPSIARPRIVELIDRALALDAFSTEAHATLGLYLTGMFLDRRRAEQELRTALELEPSYATGHQWFGLHLRVFGRLDEALEEQKIAVDLDPLSPIVNASYALTLVERGRIAEGTEHLLRTASADPRFAMVQFFLGLVHFEAQEFDSAIERFQTALGLVPGDPRFLAGLGRAYAKGGQESAAERVLSELSARAGAAYVPRSVLGAVEYGLDLREAAFKHFREAVDETDPMLQHMISTPGWIDLRQDPTFMELRDRLLAKAETATARAPRG